MKTPARARELGQAGLALIIVIAWALTAVVMLTRTLVSAEQIDRKVGSITGSLSEVEGETNLVEELVKTEKTAAAILDAAKPIPITLRTVDETAKSISTTVASIGPNATSILSTVGSINGHVASILATARSIDGTLGTITGQAVTIRQTVDAIKIDTRTIQVQTNGANGIRAHTCKIVLSECRNLGRPPS